MGDVDDALFQFGPVEHGLDVQGIGIVQVVEHPAEVAVLGDGAIWLRIGLAHEPEGCAGEFAATEIGLREALSFGGTAVEHGCVFGLLFVGTRFRLAVEFLLFGIGQPFGSGVAGWQAALDGDEVEFCVETVFHIA